MHSSPGPGAPDVTPFAYGGSNWIPVAGDWDGSGRTGIGVFDQSTATWYLKEADAPGAPDLVFRYGAPGWIPVVGDWAGSGHTGVGVFDSHTATFYLRNENSAGAPDAGQFRYGAPGWTPVVGDWDGNGTTTVGVVDPASMTWYLKNSNTQGAPDIAPFAYGMHGWVPVVGDWGARGKTTVGVYDPGWATWYLRDSNGPGAPDIAPFAYGGSQWTPLSLPEISSWTVQLAAPDFTTSTTPAVTVQLTPRGKAVAPPQGLRTAIDIDLNGDGQFAGPTGLGQWSANSPAGASSLTLGNFPTGTYALRARVTDATGSQYVSAPVTLKVDPNAGFLGSQVLQSVAQAAGAGLDDKEGKVISSQPGAQTLTQQFPYLSFNAQQQIGVNVIATLPKYLQTLETELQGIGMTVTLVQPSQDLIQGFLPPSEILALPTLPHFSSATPVFGPVYRTGSVTSQGDKVIKADTFRSSTGLTGAGETVGIISDSINKVNGGIAASQKTNDLPPVVNVLQDGPDAGATATDEGRAMAEIVYDVAPGAALAFHNDGGSAQAMANAIDALRTQAKANVIVDDVGFLDSPYFNDGLIAQAAERAVGNGVPYVTAAGNDGPAGFTTNWRGVPNTTVAGLNGTFTNLGVGSTSTFLQPFTLAKNAEMDLVVQWDDSYLEGGGGTGALAVQTDLAVYVTDLAGTKVLGTFDDKNANTGEALEMVHFTNNDPSATQFALAYRLMSGPAPTMLRWLSVGTDPAATNEGTGPTMYGQTVAKGIISAAAAPYHNPKVPEPFESVGGNVPILFDNAGNRLSQPDIRAEPIVTGPDDVDTTFFGTDDDKSGFPNFSGTSAAAPHAAAAAALLLEQQPGTSPATILQHLQQTALDIAAPGFDPLTGAGLIQVTPLPGGITGGPGGSGGLQSVINETNTTSDTAADMGRLTAPASFSNIPIALLTSGQYDQDWFKWVMPQSGVFTATLSNIRSNGDLWVRVFVRNSNGTLTQLADSTLTGGVTTQQAATVVSAGEQIYVWVLGFNFATGLYDMAVTLK
jgi:hypothetical protein